MGNIMGHLASPVLGTSSRTRGTGKTDTRGSQSTVERERARERGGGRRNEKKKGEKTRNEARMEGGNKQ